MDDSIEEQMKRLGAMKEIMARLKKVPFSDPKHDACGMLVMTFEMCHMNKDFLRRLPDNAIEAILTYALLGHTLMLGHHMGELDVVSLTKVGQS